MHPHRTLRPTLWHNQHQLSKSLLLSVYNSSLTLASFNLPNAPFNCRRDYQEEFPDLGDGDDTFYDELNLESFDASTMLVNVLGLGALPQQQPPTPAMPIQPTQGPLQPRKARKARDG